MPKSSCSSCHKSFSTRNELISHQCLTSRSTLAEVGRFSCKLCPSNFRKVHNLLRHIKEYHEHKEIEDPESFNRPLDKHDERAYWETFFCKLCDKTFKRPSYFQKHMRTCHGKSEDGEDLEPEVKKSKKSELSSAADREMACVICEAVFFDYYDLEDHEKTHEEDTGCEKRCRNCGTSFENMTKLRAHVYDVHELKVKENVKS